MFALSFSLCRPLRAELASAWRSLWQGGLGEGQCSPGAFKFSWMQCSVISVGFHPDK